MGTAVDRPPDRPFFSTEFSAAVVSPNLFNESDLFFISTYFFVCGVCVSSVFVAALSCVSASDVRSRISETNWTNVHMVCY